MEYIFILMTRSNIYWLKHHFFLTLELNAKGVILQAFEEYRVRSCVDFKPYEGETTYISFTKLSGWAE